eukprot:g288.t1
MGVTGLWQLLSPAGRQVSVETLSEKMLAVDVSIWLVQFLKAMRDDTGRPIPNAHLIGTFRRICKLLYHRILPVMVFDGGAPQLKRRTLLKRSQRREKEAANLKKTAQKLLLYQQAMYAKQVAEAKKMAKSKKKSEKTHEKDDASNNAAVVSGFTIVDNDKERDDTKMRKGKKTVSKLTGRSSASLSAQEEDSELSSSNTGLSITEERRQFNERREKKAKAFQEYQQEQETITSVNRWRGRASGRSTQTEADRFIDLNFGKTVDHKAIDFEVLAALPPKMQYQIGEQLERRERQEHRKEYLPHAGDAAKYSATQLAGFLNRSQLKKTIKLAQNAKGDGGMGTQSGMVFHSKGKGKGTSSSTTSRSSVPGALRIASDAGKSYFLLEGDAARRYKSVGDGSRDMFGESRKTVLKNSEKDNIVSSRKKKKKKSWNKRIVSNSVNEISRIGVPSHTYSKPFFLSGSGVTSSSLYKNSKEEEWNSIVSSFPKDKKVIVSISSDDDDDDDDGWEDGGNVEEEEESSQVVDGILESTGGFFVETDDKEDGGKDLNESSGGFFVESNDNDKDDED